MAITALLGPTNTGKTYAAIEAMLTHNDGVIGFPLRLLARENYDKLVERKGKHAVALVTGEEKIIPAHARYYVCTVEAMPVEKDFDFLAIDEVQLCGDPERGHVFTDRILRARGRKETMFLGAETVRPILKQLVQNIEIDTRPRLSTLSYTGFGKISRLPRRSAVVTFSMEDVYRIADQIKRMRGGTAIVLGALSPRTRNAQVEMYQSGEVDYMVATDAIGMGLNMDIRHVALAGTRKFDGAQTRSLSAAEMAQIAGRAGRHMKDGTFGCTGPVRGLDDEVVSAIESHVFPPLEAAYWRNARLDFSSVKMLQKSLEESSGNAVLVKGRPSDDYVTLSALMAREDVAPHVTTPDTVRLLWEVCQIPDFRNNLSDHHQALVTEIFVHLLKGPLPEDWVSGQIQQLNSTDGDVDRLMTRLSYIRTWTYITHHATWLNHAEEWQNKAKNIEDRLSDALHDGLTKRFVDRRSSTLIRGMQEGGKLLAGIKKDGEVVVEGHRIGHLHGFRFIPDENMSGADGKTSLNAARQALSGEIARRVRDMQNADDKQFTLAPDGSVLYQKDATNPMPGEKLGFIQKGQSHLAPEIKLIESDLLHGQDKEAVHARLNAWRDSYIAATLAPLIQLKNIGDDASASARGIAFQLVEALGLLPRHILEDLIAGLDEENRRVLRKAGVRMGPVMVYMPDLGKPAAVRLRGLLWNIWNDKPLPANVPPDGMVSLVVNPKEIDRAFYRAVGYPVFGPRAIRADMMDRVVCLIYDNAKEGTFRAEHKMAEWIGCNIDDLYAILGSLGHVKVDEPVNKEPENAESVREETVSETPTDDENAQPAPATPQPAQEKPQLALFRLKKGKAADRKRPPKKDFMPSQKPKARKGKPPKALQKERTPKVITAGPTKPSEDDSPFAILKQLKSGNE